MNNDRAHIAYITGISTYC